ncbi:hypothetical protein VOLCADRAFT_104442 [Volvox carteri f. nagariensis]|uniref:Uncharacterized protein n=1 Tax=Volvox carteri f. nagariensis TaxID=3068 RepID=D8TTN0_VOLCA|nr:uncharacterized protein VOLCADRAFT_104442 [Volvox carteri f. nagariensis]EFJ49338.1 hypothetical protein VOLCADRAFT_104442 [Volvox carteri f. nagariensis]|eukprot:XP_002949786.1 hypothetical protein VOLCADRAFT_104442 [Volvox carteri f. nagariensis]
MPAHLEQTLELEGISLEPVSSPMAAVTSAEPPVLAGMDQLPQIIAELPPQGPPPLHSPQSAGSRAAPQVDPQLQLENQRMREELGQLRRRLQAGSEVPAALELENQRLRDEVDSLVRKLQVAAEASKAAAAFNGSGVNPGNTANESLIRQLREFNQKKTSELQRKAQQSETRAVMAEEQLEQLQAYLAKASVAYQKEIVRLRSIIGQMETSMGATKASALGACGDGFREVVTGLAQ